jgi:hypothetical protein
MTSTCCADELVPDSWRVKNANDIVTRVPSLLGYHHIGVEVQMFPDGQLTISRESSDDLREGAFAADIIPKIKGACHMHCYSYCHRLLLPKKDKKCCLQTSC